ncbi:hypothetical protein RJ641_008238 [Dillenia turbinata]|uniref:J domain-containing protein n=1 Tax=Dillenia turbinata TaxID=194707 RepID=A0AAN8Z4T2_9MAGN
MSLFTLPAHHFSAQFHDHRKLFERRRNSSTVIRCCSRGMQKRAMRENYYELLGVSVDSNSQQIKEAYRKLQKKFHPDIAGQGGHEQTLKLNEAYQVLMSEDLRRHYDASIGHMKVGAFGSGYSTWKGPLRPQALFVDENACIGCRECVYHASNTFAMDDTLGCARVKVQCGDDEKNIEVSVESCPVNCIHWVDLEELPVLEFLIQPQPKEAYGVFGGGWERPANVFAAAKAFSKQLKREKESNQRNTKAAVEEETPAQAKARAHATKELQRETFSRILSWMKDITGLNR